MGVLAAAGIGLMIGGKTMQAGSKVKIPEFVPLDLNAETAKANKITLDNFKDTSKIGELTNTFNFEQSKKALDFFAPGNEDVTKMQRDLAKQEMSGVLGDQQMKYLRDYSASSGLGKGFGALGSSAAAQNNYARNLGISSLALQSSGFSHAQQWLAEAQNRTPQMYDISRSFITPAMQANVTSQNNLNQYQRNLGAANVAALPDPKTAAIGSALSGIGSMALGGAMGGGGGGGMGGGGGAGMSFGQLFSGIGGMFGGQAGGGYVPYGNSTPGVVANPYGAPSYMGAGG